MAYSLEVRGVSLRFGGVRALTEVSFGVNDGELFSIIGPNPLRGNAAPRKSRPFPVRSDGPSASRHEVALNKGKRYVEMSSA